MPTDKRTHSLNKKNNQHKKCGAITADGSACRHTAKKNGRCHAHSARAIPLKLKKEENKKLRNTTNPIAVLKK